MRAALSHPDCETTQLRIALADARSEKALGAALDALTAATKDLAALLANPKDLAREAPCAIFLVTTFDLPKNKTLDERAFFERCVRFPKLHAKMVRYVRSVNSRNHRVRGLSEDLAHDEEHPAGCFAIVPLALADKRYIDPLIEHMLGWDMDHETFHAALIDELVRRYGICAETLRLLAYRAVDGGGQHGCDNLAMAYQKHGLEKALRAPDAIEAFATLIAKQSGRVPGAGKRGDGPRHYLEIYVANAAHALFGGDGEKVARFIGVFQKRKVKFEPDMLEPGKPFKPFKIGAFSSEW